VGRLLDQLTYIEFRLSPKLKVDPILELRFEDFLSNGISATERIAIFAVYCNRVEDEIKIRNQVNALLSQFELVLVINTGLTRLEHNRIKRVFFIDRSNIGRDLVSYAQGAKLLQALGVVGDMMFINDSIDWDQETIDKFLEIAAANQNVVTAAACSKQISPHMQTFLFYVPRHLSAKILVHIAQIRMMRSKRATVTHGERRLSKVILKHGITITPAIDDSVLQELTLRSDEISLENRALIAKLIKEGVNLNPSIHYWPALWETLRLKKHAIDRSNPAKF
jgi:hypothetical protein